MNELKRLYGKKTLFILLAVIILNTGLFIMSCTSERAITLTGDELDAYISGYDGFIEKTRENSMDMSLMNMYKSGFAAENIRKTVSAYEKLYGTELVNGDNRGIVLFIQYSLSDIFLSAFLMILSVSMLSERKKGLAKMVRSTKKGRVKLYFSRVLILAFSSLAASVLLYGGNYIGMLFSFGSTDTARNIQSLPEFMQCPYRMTVGEYVFCMIILKAAAGFIISLVFFLMISIFGTAVSYTLSAVLAFAEFLMYRYIAPVSSFSVLRYINIFSFIKVYDYFSGCHFINIFGNAVSVLRCTIVFSAVFIVIMILLGAFVHGRMYVSDVNGFGRMRDKIFAFAEKISFQRTLIGWESYKILIKQGGAFFMLASFFLALLSSAKYDYFYKINSNELEWYEKYYGDITESSVLDAENDLKKLEDTIVFFEKYIDELNAKGKTDDRRIPEAYMSLAKAEKRHDGLIPVLENMHSGLEYTERTGNTVRLIKPFAYDLLIMRDVRTRSRASLYILIGIIGAVSGVYSYDTRNNMRDTIHSSYRGRKISDISKAVPVIAVCILLCTAVHLIQFVQIGNVLKYNDLDAPVQSLAFMRDFDLYMSISEYIFILFVLRAIASCMAGMVCVFVSRLCSDTASSMGVSAFVLAVPSVFAEITDNKFMSAVYLISGEYFK